MRSVALVVLTAAGAAVLVLYLLQGRILFPRVRVSEETVARIEAAHPELEPLSIGTLDGVNLHGWLVRSGTGGRAPLVIYFGGNGEEVSWMVDRAPELAGWGLVLVNYRGYGLSEGRPSERALRRDSLCIYDHVTRRDDVDGERVVALGRSLGSGIAVYLARERSLRGVILVSPYDSITAVARETFPFLPVRLLLRHRFEAASWAAEVRTPMLALIAGQDTVISPERSLRLASAWGGPRETRVLAGAGHNSIDRHPEYWRSIRGFLGIGETP